jgi:hypothetical protein
MNEHRFTLLTHLAILALTGVVTLGCNVKPEGDDDDTSGDDDDATSVSIYDLHAGLIEQGEYVTLVDKIVTTPKGESGFYIQEPDGGEYSGLYIYCYDEPLGTIEVEPGYVVTVSGSFSEWHYESDLDGEMTEITLTTAADYEVTAQTDAPAPVAVTIDDLAYENAEPWEGVLIDVAPPMSVTAGPDSYGVWEVSGVAVDSFFTTHDPEVGAGVEKLTGVVDYSFWSYHVLPRYETDVVFGDAVPAETYTVYEVQQGDAPEGPVRLEDVVVTTPITQPFSDCEFQGFWVQEQGGGPYSGIFVEFLVEDIAELTLQPGDVINVDGAYQEFYDVSELVIDSVEDVEVTGTAAEPDAIILDDPCVDEQTLEGYEGVLIQFFSSQAPLQVTSTVDDIGYGQFEVNGCFLIDSLFFEYDDCGGTNMTPDPPAGTDIQAITGALHYSYSAYKLEPRGADDFLGWTP